VTLGDPHRPWRIQYLGNADHINPLDDRDYFVLIDIR
jgi:hypothetical protein